MIHGIFCDLIEDTSLATAKLATSALLERINKLNAQFGRIDEFTLASIEREANKLTAIDPGLAWEILSIVAASRSDIPAMQSSFKNAEAQRRGDGLLQLNYSISLRRVGLFSEAVDRAWTSLQQYRDDPHVLQQAAETFQLGLAMDKYLVALDCLYALGAAPLVEHEGKDSRGDIKNHLDYLASKKLASHDITAALQAVRLLIGKQGYQLEAYRYSLEHDGAITLYYGISASAEVCARLNFEIADVVLENSPDALPEVLVVSTNPHEELVEVAE